MSFVSQYRFESFLFSTICCIAGLSSILLLIVCHVNMIQAARATGPCKDAGRGQSHHKCELQCNLDGSCRETVTEEQCGCDGMAEMYSKYSNFKVNSQTRLHQYVNSI